MIKQFLLGALMVFTIVSPVLAQETAQDRIVAKVNNDIITSGDIWSRYRLIQKSSGLPDNADIRRDAFPQILNGLIDEKLQLQEAARLNIEVTDQMVQSALQEIATNNNAPSVDVMQEAMAKQGVNIEEIKRQIRPQIAWGGVVQRAVKSDVAVDEAELVKLRDDLNKNKGVTEYKLAEIKLEASDAAREKDSMALAKNLFKEMAKGAPFSKVAAKFSQSPSAKDGGLLGFITANDLPAEVAEIITKIPKGTLSNPVVADGYVWLILKLDERIGQGAPGDEELRQKLSGKRLQQAAATYLRDLRDQAAITYP